MTRIHRPTNRIIYTLPQLPFQHLCPTFDFDLIHFTAFVFAMFNLPDTDVNDNDLYDLGIYENEFYSEFIFWPELAEVPSDSESDEYARDNELLSLDSECPSTHLYLALVVLFLCYYAS